MTSLPEVGLYESLARLRARLLLDTNPEFVHIYPPWDHKDHVIGPRGTPCWCNPQLDEVDHRIVVHNPSH